MGNYGTAYGKPVDQINFGAARFAPVLPRPPGGRHDNSKDKNINKEVMLIIMAVVREVVAWKRMARCCGLVSAWGGRKGVKKATEDFCSLVTVLFVVSEIGRIFRWATFPVILNPLFGRRERGTTPPEVCIHGRMYCMYSYT